MTLETKTVSDQVLVTLRRIIRAIDLHSKDLAQKYGLTGPQLSVLKELDRLTEITLGEVAKNISLSPATVTDIVSRLEKNGWVQRVRDVVDKRRVYARLTDAGLDVLRQSPALLQDRFIGEFESLQDWEQTQILSSVQRIATLMEAPPADVAPMLFSGEVNAVVEQSPAHAESHPPINKAS